MCLKDSVKCCDNELCQMQRLLDSHIKLLQPFSNCDCVKSSCITNITVLKDMPNRPVAHPANGKKYMLIGPQVTC